MDETLAEIINVNFTGVVFMTRNVFRLMSKSNDYGIIVNINSIAGHSVPYHEGDAITNVYSGTKHAITATTESIRHELIKLKNDKIRITVS
jgi:NADP-dependent 3-hydroxy acid dehydrogenase YdfG